MLIEHQWNEFHRDGFMHLGKVLELDEIGELKERADELALGNAVNPSVQMQLDTGGAYDALPGAVAKFEAGTLLYRKIQGLESDDLFARLIRQPVFQEVCAQTYGKHASISIFRAMVMNKPAGQGTRLPWHQDGGHVWQLDRDPLVTIWVALDAATVANGCMEAIPGSHHLGLLSLFGSTLKDEHVAIYCPSERIHALEVPAGHAILLHNWLIHRSGINPSSSPRRAFTMCCMDARTRSVLTGNHFPVVYGDPCVDPHPYIVHLEQERHELRHMASEAEKYALSLRDENLMLSKSIQQATGYAKSLEQEIVRLGRLRDEVERYAKTLEAELRARPSFALNASNL